MICKGLGIEIFPMSVHYRVGASVDFICSYKSTEDLDIEFEKVYSRTVQMKVNGNVTEKYEGGGKGVYQVWLHPGLLAVKCSVRNKNRIVVGVVTALIYEQQGLHFSKS